MERLREYQPISHGENGSTPVKNLSQQTVHGNGESLSTTPQFPTVKNKHLRTVRHLLDSDAMTGLSFEQKRALFIFSAWHYVLENQNEYVALDISKEERDQAAELVWTNLASRYERLEEMSHMVGRIRERGIKNPVITEFDYWVYQMWQASEKPVKILVHHIPFEFDLDRITPEARMKRIFASLKKLTECREVNEGFKKRRKRLLQKNIVSFVDRNGLSSPKNIAHALGVGETTITRDLKVLRKRKAVSEGRKVLTKSQKRTLAKKILTVIKAFEAEDKSYTEGDIGPAEIAKRLGMERRYITNFILHNGSYLHLPKRDNPRKGRQMIREKYKNYARQLLEKDPNLSIPHLYKLLRELDPNIPFAMTTLYDFRDEIRQELEQSRNGEKD